MKRLFKKAMRDLLQDKRRTFLSFLSILIGMVAFGVVLFSYEIIDRELIEEFDAINPASASLQVDRIDQKLLDLTADFEGIEYFEDKAYYEMRVQTSEDEWKTLELHAAENYSELNLNMITSESGSYQPGDGEMLIERDAIGVAGISVGDSLDIMDSEGVTWSYEVTGAVADVYQHPASIHNSVYVYVSYDSLARMGLVSNQIDFLISGDPYDRMEILSVSNSYIKMLEQNGYTAVSLDVSETPGISMHYEEYVSTLFLLQVFSFVMFLLGCMIMSGLISSILSSQIRQIGILKAIGTDTKKILLSYLYVFIKLIAVLVVISIPLSTWISKIFTQVTMGLSNMRPTNFTISWQLFAIYGIFALVIPMTVAYFPLRRGIRITVKEALNQQGVKVNMNKKSSLVPAFLSRPVLLSLRNAVQKKNRFILNVVILTIGGALFVAVITSMIATQTTLNNNLDTLDYDYQVTTSEWKNAKELEEIMDMIPNVTAYENWGVSSGKLIYTNGEIGNSYSICAPQEESNMIHPDIIEGRWIAAEAINEIVVSHKFLVSEPDYAIGDSLAIQMGDHVYEFLLVGVMKDLGDTTIFMSEQGFRQYVSKDGQFNSIKMSIELTGRKKTSYSNVESALQEQGIGILSSESKSDMYDIMSGHFTVTLQTFTFVIFMLVIVSGFGLAATMNAQTSERTKEMGIMKAMGASRKQIARIVTAESMFISLISWLISLVAGIPLGLVGIYIFGNLIIEAPLDMNFMSFVISFMLWLLLTFVIGYAASRSSAKRAANISIRECLTYE